MSPALGSAALFLIPLLALAAAPRLDALAVVMLALVTFVAVVIHRYARRYLDGQAAAPHYRRWFVATIAAASLLVTAGDLRILALAWTASSLSLHQLLTFFADRPQAQVAAHKKFLLSRLADVAIYAAVFLLGRAFGTYDIAALGAAATAMDALPASVHAAGYLLVAGVALRSAQLPFHGWLIQVMEAPTPVSALLHAGVVNIGGYVLIRLAALMGLLPGAMTALVVIGATTAVLAALVMMTRVTVKVALAWSTAAQMGFMLLECGLGAWELALLHLIAHSCYKAHAFLGSGGVVALQARRAVALTAPRPTATRWIVGALGGASIAALAAVLAWPDVTTDPRAWVAVGILALALAPFFVRLPTAGSWRASGTMLGAALLVAALYAAWHTVFAALLPTPLDFVPGTASVIIALAGFVALYVVQAMVSVRPHARAARALHAWAFAGFHLDELFTRATFLVWPPRHVRRQASGLRAITPVSNTKVAA
jgi:NAD(P)H-quinone oxidoreductase subunit 5